MEALINKILTKLQRLPVSELETTLEFVDALDKQTNQPPSDDLDVDESEISTDRFDEQAKWQAFVQAYSGIWPDFPLVEEIREGLKGWARMRLENRFDLRARCKYAYLLFQRDGKGNSLHGQSSP